MTPLLFVVLRMRPELGVQDDRMWDLDASPLVSTELLEQLGDAVTVIGFDWRYRYVSKRAAVIIGRPASEVVGVPVWEVFPEVVGTPEHAACVRAMEQRTAVKFVWFFDTVGRWFEQHAIPTPTGLVIVVNDVTEREEDARRAGQLLAVGDALAQAMSVADVAAVFQRQVLPALGATGGALMLVDEADGVARATGHVGWDEEFVERWSEIPLTMRTPSLDAYRSGEPVILEDVDIARRNYPHLVERLSSVRDTVVVAFPLISAGTPLGALVAHFSKRPLNPRDRRFMATAAGMCAQAVIRARLFDAEKRSVEALQRHLLPQRLPDIRDVEIAVRYDASGSTVDIGGDWFDVIPLPEGAVGMVIGDVEGHDVEAAALMGLVRSAVRAYALEGHPPAFILDRANQFVNSLHVERLVTVSYVQLHPNEHLATVASAGHLSPMVLSPDGEVSDLPCEVGPPLGAGEGTLSWPETTSMVPTGAVLTAFTDGLVERRDDDISVGLDWVRGTLAGTRGDPLESVASALVRGRTSDNDDDIAILMARVTAAEVDPSKWQVTRRLPPTAASVFIARRFVTQVLTLWSVPEETSDSVELAISELATNAARHSEDLIEVHLIRTHGRLRVAVGDSDHRTPRRQDPDDASTAGRGLFLVDAISARWGVDSNGLGKTVWCEFNLPSSEE